MGVGLQQQHVPGGWVSVAQRGVRPTLHHHHDRTIDNPGSILQHRWQDAAMGSCGMGHSVHWDAVRGYWGKFYCYVDRYR